MLHCVRQVVGKARASIAKHHTLSLLQHHFTHGLLRPIVSSTTEKQTCTPHLYADSGGRRAGEHAAAMSSECSKLLNYGPMHALSRTALNSIARRAGQAAALHPHPLPQPPPTYP